MNRVDCILNYLQPNHKVLHVGCCGDDHSFEQEWKAGTALHKYLHDLLGDNLIGVDINEKRVRELNDKGMKALVGDAHNLPKSIGKFDVIVAGEVIEHLENPGLFLRSARQLLREGSRLILTTPNVLGVLFWLRHGVLKKKEPWPEHVCYFTPTAITQLLEREGFSNIALHHCNYSRVPRFFENVTLHPCTYSLVPRFFVKKFLYRFWPHFQNTLVVICE